MRSVLLAALFGLVGTVVMVAPGPGTGTVDAVSTVSCDAPSGTPGAASRSGGFVGRIPERLADTRGTDAIPADCWLRVRLPSSVPSDATAVALTVTSDRVPQPGYLTVHPCGSGLPELSNLNIRTEGPNSNFAVVAVDDTREVCVYSDGGTHAIVDLVGHFGPGGARLQELEPRRVFDSRDPARRPSEVTGPLAPRQVVVVDRDRMGLPSDASAVMVNLTVAEAAAPGFLTAYPCAGERPPTSNVNYEQGGARANTSIVALSAQGTMCIELDAAAADVIVDLVGFFGEGDDGLEYQVGMSRVADSRGGLGGWDGPFAADETRSFDPDLTTTLPDGTRVAVLGVVATRSEAAGFLQVRPCGSDNDVSSVNYVPNVDITNLVVVPLDDDGTVCVTSSASTDVVVDLFGGFGTDGLMRSLSVGPHEVFPDFRADVHDYVAYCPATTGNDFDVAARGMPGTTVQLVGGSSGSPRLSTGATRDADDALVLRVTPASGPAEEYWVRCLPPDFPRVSIVERPGDPEPGWYLINKGTATANFGIILDTHGVPVWYKRGRQGTPLPEPRGLQRLEDGTLTWFQALGFAFGIDPTNRFQQFTLNGDVLATHGVEASGAATNHHELLPLPNGNFLVTSMPLRDPAGNTPCHVQDGSQPSGFRAVTADKVAGALIQEITPSGDVVWQWDAEGQIGLAETTVRLCFYDPQADAHYLSAIHPNGVAVRNGGQQVLMSSRHTDAVYAIDRGGQIVWKLGGTLRNESLTLQGQHPLAPARQHDVQVLPNGNITLFDNQTPLPFASHSATAPARHVEYRIDEAAGTADLVDQIRRPNGDASGALGSSRVQPDGAVVVNWGSVPGPVFTEFAADGEKLFEVHLDGPRFSYRTVKEPFDAFDVADLRAAAGGSID